MTQPSGFVDEAQIHVKAGNGGAGCVSFRREAHVPEGGPDGGNGGRGGSVVLVADRNVSSLLGFKDHPFRRADNGTHGSGKGKHGASGKDLVVPVPEGTVVKHRDGEVIADLARPGDRFVAGEGGRGGRGNASFLSQRRRAPSFAEQGEVGEELWLDLELKLMADVALVGFPNAGKSTLISRISAAKPKIADYPFTTLTPNLGVVRVEERTGREFVVADIPGLIEGASEGKGLGFQFLRHIERARVLVLLLDLATPEVVHPAEQERILLHELGRYRPELLERPRIVAGSKADHEDAPLWDDEWDGLRFSSITGAGLRPLVGRMADLVDQARRAEADAAEDAEGFVVHRLVPQAIRVQRDEDGAWLVVGREAERAIALNDLTNAEALTYVQQRLDHLGIPKLLAKAGAKEGEEVRIGRFSFTYEPD